MMKQFCWGQVEGRKSATIVYGSVELINFTKELLVYLFIRLYLGKKVQMMDEAVVQYCLL